jgi:3-dehydroquinate synthase
MKVHIDLNKNIDKSYDIYINELESIKYDSKVAIVTNPKLSGLHLKMLLNKLSAKELYIVTVPDGEEYKNLDTISYILDRLNEHRLDRKSLLIAFGGGVIGDMTGFAASIFLRGIDFIQIPTTLLSQVDASVGGKTGVNNRFGKNLIGSFYQPKAVYCETTFLKTLPKREFSAGVAEIVKMALTFDKDFFEWLEKNDLNKEENLIQAIKKCIEIKARVVSQDEKEAGVRAVLNYGHTFAHVIENETNYKSFLHGEAVAIGMVLANNLAMRLGLLDKSEYDRVLNILKRYDLPTNYPIENIESFYDSFFLDKKSSDKKIKFILLNHIGDYKIADDIDKDTVLAALKDS